MVGLFFLLNQSWCSVKSSKGMESSAWPPRRDERALQWSCRWLRVCVCDSGDSGDSGLGIEKRKALRFADRQSSNCCCGEIHWNQLFQCDSFFTLSLFCKPMKCCHTLQPESQNQTYVSAPSDPRLFFSPKIVTCWQISAGCGFAVRSLVDGRETNLGWHLCGGLLIQKSWPDLGYSKGIPKMLHLSYFSPLCESPLCGGINLIQRSFHQILEMIEQRVIDRNPEEVPLTGTFLWWNSSDGKTFVCGRPLICYQMQRRKSWDWSLMQRCRDAIWERFFEQKEELNRIRLFNLRFFTRPTHFWIGFICELIDNVRNFFCHQQTVLLA